MLRKPQYIPNMQLPSSTLGGWHATPTPPLGLSFPADTPVLLHPSVQSREQETALCAESHSMCDSFQISQNFREHKHLTNFESEASVRSYNANLCTCHTFSCVES